MCADECEEKVVRVKILFPGLLLIHTTLANHLCIQAADVFIISPCTMTCFIFVKHFEVLAKMCHKSAEYCHD